MTLSSDYPVTVCEQEVKQPVYIMHFSQETIITILHKYAQQSALTVEEQSALDAWLLVPEEAAGILQNGRDHPELLAYLRQRSDSEGLQAALTKFRSAAFEQRLTDEVITIAPGPKSPANSPVHRAHFLKTAWFRYAAVLLLVAGIATYLYRTNQPTEEIARTISTGTMDIQPGGNKAVLTLSDGSRILLDSAAIGTLAEQGGTQILKLNAGSITYKGGMPSGETGYNTITTPMGGQYHITLPDGTDVWLNAASWIRYPTVFAEKERRVEIIGEAYFEIAKHAAIPFRVNVNNKAEIEVLGTHFNVNAYDNAMSINTTLLEGAVRVSASGLKKQSVILKPGQQLKLSANMEVDEHADLDKAMAWRYGLFNFENASLREVMQQLERWYNVQVVYEGGIAPAKYFEGGMSREMNLSEVLAGLQQTAGVHFRIEEGRRLVVLK